MRILGIDPGSRLTGFAVIETHGDHLRACGYGVIRTGSGELPQRLGAIFDGVERVVAEMAPEALAIESVFMARNAQSALKLGQARGAAICAATRTGLAVYEYAPRAVKLAVVGSGRAEKGQIQHMMQQILQIEESLQTDAADALAVAVCHAHTQHTRGYASRQLAALALR
ncbi:crossover junction endodeoxyribonuclease RuvC [Thioalkalivibrio sp.]|uniref:crossover junction endodeoxyribonuclease RuvC n=1 Tax=Thioalkalivibrio sp. TaxID=2093813 RepID=UPI003567ED8C